MSFLDTNLGAFDCDIAFAKPRGGQLPIFTLIQQVQPFSDTDQINSSRGVSVQSQGVSFKQLISESWISWGLNVNPMIRVILSPTPDNFSAVADFPGFSKNSVVGLRFRKEQIAGQCTPWVYGVTQYAIPFLDPNVKTIRIDGHGLLVEASRRHNSRDWKNLSAKMIIADIAKHYSLGFEIRGKVSDAAIFETEQNIDDMTFLNIVSSKIDAFWMLEENTLILVSAAYLYNQSPIINFFFGNIPKENTDNYFPISSFIPELTVRSFEAGASRMTARGIDLDTGKIVEEIFTSKRTRLGVLDPNSEQFFSDAGSLINSEVLRPCPNFIGDRESGVFIPLHTRSDEDLTYQFQLENKNLSVRATLTTVGIPSIRPGMLVNVQGVGEMLSGNYIVSDVSFKLEQKEGFTSELRLVRNALGQIQTATPFKTNLNKSSTSLMSGVRVSPEPVTEN